MPMSQEKIDRHVGSKLRTLRESYGLSQAQLAEKIGRDLDTVRQNEEGVRRMSADELWQMCAVLDVRPNSFFKDLD
ncbi:MAG: helix-turn-helix transcriptional regulator [Paracoccaceae bacterium]